jgi:hypothetical protein
MSVRHARRYQTQSIKSMLTDLRMDMLTDANVGGEVPTATEVLANAVRPTTFAKEATSSFDR